MGYKALSEFCAEWERAEPGWCSRYAERIAGKRIAGEAAGVNYPQLSGHYQMLLGDLISLVGLRPIMRLVEARLAIDEVVEKAEAEARVEVEKKGGVAP